MCIPRGVYEAEETTLRAEYAAEFGAEATVENGPARAFSRSELIAHYARNLAFWRARIPDLDPGMPMKSIARHALCSNATQRLEERCTGYAIWDEVCEVAKGEAR